MNKKTIISATDNTMQKLNVLAKKKKKIKSSMVVTAQKLNKKDKLIAVKDKVGNLYKNKKTVISATDNTILKLKVLAKKKESVRGKLVVTAKQLAVTAKERENIRSKLAITAKQLASTAKEKENVRRKLVITAKQLATIANEKESVRRKLVITARQLATTAKERESVRRKLVITAKQLATTAKEKESIRRKLEVTAKRLVITANEKESVRRKLEITAKNLAKTAQKIESANRELRSLDLAKDEFVSIASHQLRTPLTALKGYTGMLLDEDAGIINDKQREYLGEIKNANDRMIKLITALLNVSRVDLGVFVVEPEPVNFEHVANSVLKDLDSNIKLKKLQIEKSFEKNIPLLSADPQITRMIFQNLLSNAVKYTPQGGHVSLKIKRDKSTLLISVTDTGYGIPKNVQSKIFTKLFRADNARVKDPNGTGLGLYIIKETIEKTGGKIWFKSKENGGSTFYVSIPLLGMKKKKGSKRFE